MIDWWSLAASALWILGLALGLAAASLAYWKRASQTAAGLPSRTSRYLHIAFDGGGVLFSFGLAASSSEAWESLIWRLLGILLTIQLWRDWRSRGA
jgi:hypothetical protein